MHKSWGNNPICFCILVVFNWFFIPMTCLFRRQTFFVLVPCAIMKSEEGLFIPWWYFHHLAFCFQLLSFQTGIFNHVLILGIDRIWTIPFLITLVCAFLVLLVFCPNCISFGSWKSCACIFTISISFGMLSFIEPLYMINSIKS